MKYSVKRDGRSGRFTTAKITASGEVVTSSSGDENKGVSSQTFRRAKKAANSSLSSLRPK